MAIPGGGVPSVHDVPWQNLREAYRVMKLIAGARDCPSVDANVLHEASRVVAGLLVFSPFVEGRL